MQELLDRATDDWGVKVERVELKDVRLPQQMQRAMVFILNKRTFKLKLFKFCYSFKGHRSGGIARGINFLVILKY